MVTEADVAPILYSVTQTGIDGRSIPVCQKSF